MRIQAYLFFDGVCAAAVEFYKRAAPRACGLVHPRASAGPRR